MSTKSNSFVGFPDIKLRPVVVPDYFFTELLPQIDNLAELKLTLHCFWLLNEQSGELRFLRGVDLRTDAKLLYSLTLDNDLRPPLDVFEDALERAVARNTLLRLEIEKPVEDNVSAEAAFEVEDWYFMNTVKGRQTVALIYQGKLDELKSVIPDEARLRVERPNIFKLYEQNIGFMTPLIADQLRDLEKSYAPTWVEEAFDIAVGANKRSLRYIQAILKRWETEGKNSAKDETAGRDTEEQRRRKYIPDEFADVIVH